MNLKERIRAAMDQAGVDALELASRMRDQGQDVSYNTVYQWAIGRRTPHAENMPAIAAALGLSLDELYGTEPAVVKSADS